MRRSARRTASDAMPTWGTAAVSRGDENLTKHPESRRLFHLVMCGMLIAVMVCGEPGTTSAADVADNRYSVLYGGNYSDEDARRFAYRLYYYGGAGSWSGKTQSSYFGDEDDVNHWDVTNGYPGCDPWPGANARDLLYLSTHGAANLMTFYDPSYQKDPDREEDLQGRADNIGPKVGVGPPSEKANWEIGSDFLDGSMTRTTSRWDDDIEWVFLAACSQLSSDDSSRIRYARTLLGDPHRAHAVFGYDAVAPGDGFDVKIVDRFFDYLASYSIRYSWLAANDDYAANNACCIIHSEHELEGLPPVRYQTPDTPTWETPDIHYWYIPSWAYSQQPVASTSWAQHRFAALWSEMLAWLDRWFLSGTAYANAPEYLRGERCLYRVTASIPRGPDQVPVLIHTADGESSPSIALRLLGVGSDEDTVPCVGDTRVDRFKKGSRTVVCLDEGSYQVFEGVEPTKACTLTSDDAIRLAREYLAQTDALPMDAQVTSVRAMTSTSVDPMAGMESTPVASVVVVEFGHSYDGIPVRGVFADRIVCRVSDGGVFDYRRSWHAAEALRRGKKIPILSAEDALSVIAREGERVLDIPDETEISEIELVYYAPERSVRGQVLFPAWRIRVGGFDVFVNAVTGRVMCE